MISRKRILYVSLAAIAVCSSANFEVQGRGGGGGGGGRGFGGGGGYDRGGFGGGYDRGFDDRAENFLRGDEGYGRMDSGGYQSAGLSANRAGAFTQQHTVSDADLRAAANHEYTAGSFDHNLATDAGFNRIAVPQAGAYMSRVSPQELTARGSAVRQNFNNYNLYNRGWWNNHPYAWRYPYYYNSGWAWGYGGWGAYAGFWGLPVDTALPEYDYGNNITYNNNEVYYGTQPTCTADQYYTQAQNLADTASPTSALVSPQPSGQFTIDGAPPGADDWKSVGVFSLTQGAQTDSSSIFQLAVDKNGIIRGNYVNELTGNVETVQGAVDKKSMRAAWTVGDNRTVVYDTGFSTLLGNQGSLLIHFSKERTEQWTLVRLQPPTTTTTTKTS